MTTDVSTPRRTPTIRAVAERAGVSKSLVSLVLQGSSHVSDHRRSAVLQAMADLDYQPNAQARALKQSRSDIVAVVLQDLRNPWFIDAVDGIAAVLQSRGLQMLLCEQRLDLRADEALMRALRRMRVDGIVVVGTLEEAPVLAEATRGTPTVVLGTRDWWGPATDTVATDDRLGVRLALDHLLELGHRRIAHIAVPSVTVGKTRQAAYEERMGEAGLDDHVVVAASDNSEDGGFRAAIRILARPERPTGILAYNDVTALGALSAARELRLDVPGDVSIIGYDNSQLARTRAIGLTTIDIANGRIGRQAATALVQRIESPDRPATLSLLDPVLVPRATTGPVPR